MAFLLFYLQPTWLFGQTIAGKSLYGHITSLKLSQVPMSSHQGKTLNWDSFAKNPLYITTGFTSCPNTCPVTMSYYGRLATQLEQLEQRATFSLLTIDPRRDTPEVLEAYLHAINKKFVGLIVEDSRLLSQVTNELKQSVFVSQGGEQIIHKGYIYLIHPNVDGLIVYDQTNLDIDKMLNDFQLLAKNNAFTIAKPNNSEAKI